VAATRDLRSIGDEIEARLEELRTADPRLADRAETVLRLVTELYGGALERVVGVLADGAPDALRQLAADDLVASLLLVHGLHPDDVATRVEAALARVRPLLGAHAGDVELLGVDLDAGTGEATVRLRLLGSCDGCPSSAVTLQLAVERAVLDAAPEVVAIEVDQPSLAPPAVPVRLVPKPAPAYEVCPSELVGG
jgi:Fe-S cluster biogenesis protein NfuA